jgi:hypothetical protein
MAARSALVLDG